MIRKLRIAVDHGNKNMKTCNQVFTTALITQDKKPARGEEYIFYEGKYYLLSNRRIPYQRDKTEDERFFVLTLFAIVKELKKYPQIAPEDVLQIICQSDYRQNILRICVRSMSVTLKEKIKFTKL